MAKKYTSYDAFKAIRKPMAPPTKVFGFKKPKHKIDLLEDYSEYDDE